MFCLVRRLHNNPSGWFRGECVLIEVLEAPILSICCILGFQATIALHDASIHFRHFSQDWHLRTNKRRKPKTELKPSFLYVLARFFSSTKLLIWFFQRYNQPFSKNPSEFLPFGPSSLGHQGCHDPNGWNFNTKISPLDAIASIVAWVSDPMGGEYCLISTHPTFGQILEETLGEQEKCQTTLLYDYFAIVIYV